MKTVTIAVAVLTLAAAGILILQVHTAALVASAQLEQIQRLNARLDAAVRDLELTRDGLSDEMATARRDSEADLEALQGRMLASLASLEQRVGSIRLELEPVVAQAPVPTPGQPPELDLTLQAAMTEASVLFEAGRFAEARPLLSRILEQQPENDRARLLHAISLYQENPADSAAYKRIEGDLEPLAREPAALRVLALVAVERMQWAEGAAWFRRLIAVAPGNASDLKMAGLCALRLEDAAQAHQWLEQALRLAGNDPETWHYAALACVAAGETAEALTRFQRCLSLDAGFEGARVRAGALLLELGRCREALEMLRPARRSSEVARAVGDCHDRLGEAGAARAAWLEAVALAREDSDGDRSRVSHLYLSLARSAFESGAYADCVSYCAEGARRDQLPELRAYRGAAQIALGETEEGRRLLQETLAGHPNDKAGALAALLLANARAGGRR